MKLAATAKLWNIFSNQEIKLSVYNEYNTIPTQQRTLAKGRKLIFLHFNILLIKKYPHYDFKHNLCVDVCDSVYMFQFNHNTKYWLEAP